jgi:hypothetical protein
MFALRQTPSGPLRTFASVCTMSGCCKRSRLADQPAVAKARLRLREITDDRVLQG